MDRVCFATGETVTVRGKTGLWTVIDDDSASNRIIVEQKNSLCVDDTTFDSTLNTWLVLKPREVFSTQLEVRAEPVATLLPNDNAIETCLLCTLCAATAYQASMLIDYENVFFFGFVQLSM